MAYSLVPSARSTDRLDSHTRIADSAERERAVRFWERLVHLEAATKAAQTCADELNTLKSEFARVR